MQRMSPGALLNLLAATESVSDDEPIGGSIAHCWKQFELPNRKRNIVFLLLESERARHAAAARRRRFKINADAFKDCFLIRHLHDRLLMTMAVHQRLAF